MNIPLRRLGKSDLQLSPLGLGCWQFSKQTGIVGKNWPALSNNNICKCHIFAGGPELVIKFSWKYCSCNSRVYNNQAGKRKYRRNEFYAL